MAQNINAFDAAETRLVRETSYGVTPGSPAWKRVNGFGVVPSPTVETDPFSPPGMMIPGLVLVNDDFSEGSVEGRLDFNALPYVISGMLGQPTITDLGGSPNAYQWVWTWDGRRAIRRVSYTLHNGFPDSADVVTGWIFNTLEIQGGRADGFDVSGEGFGKAALAGQAMGGITNEVQAITATGTVSGGTYTITVAEIGETTTAIAYNANTATIQAALDALVGVESGDIVVGGGTLPGTPATLTYGGPNWSGKNVAQITIDSTLLTGGGTYDPSTTTPGADSVTDIEAVPAGATYGNVYLDTAWGNLGNTQALYIYEMGVNFGEMAERTRPINKSKSSDGVIDMADQEHTITLMFGRNAVADAQLAKLRAGTKSFVRAEWEGEVISGANDYLLQVDACVIYTEAGEPEDVDGVHAREYTGSIANDGANALRITVVNTIAGL